MVTTDGGFDWQSPSARLVMDAVLDLLAEVGYEGLTLGDVRERAGAAGKALDDSVDLDALVSAALSRIELLKAPDPTGSLRQDLRALLSPWRNPRTRDEVIIAAVLSAADWRPTLRKAVHRALERPAASAIGTILSRHMSDQAMVGRPQTLSWLLRGLILERLQTGPRSYVDLDGLVDFLIAGLAAPTPGQASAR